MKKIITKTFLAISILLIGGHSFSQTSFTENFDDNTLAPGWFGNTHYQLTETNQELLVTMNGTSLWEGFGYNLPAPVNMANNPCVSLRFKSGKTDPCTFGVYVLDANSNNTVVIQKIMTPNIYGEYTFSFRNIFKANNIDSTNITKLLFIFDPTYTGTGTFYMDDINVGSSAKVYPNIFGIPDQGVFMNASEHIVNLRGINDGTTGTNAISISASSSDPSLIPNPSIVYTSPNSTADLKYTPVAGKTGTAVITVKVSAPGADDHNITFNIKVSGNLPPTIASLSKIIVPVGVTSIIDIGGIDDGNPEIKQDMTVTASSGTTSVIPNPLVNYTSDHSHAYLSINPATTGTSTITVQVKDNGGTDGGAIDTKSMSFDVQVYTSINHVPTIDLVASQSVSKNVAQIINLTGITDGDDGTQNLTVTATHTSQFAMTNPVVTYTSGKNAVLKYTPKSVGVDTIIVTVSDNAGNAGNNGSLSTVMKIVVNIVTTNPTGLVEDFSVPAGQRSWNFYPGPFETINEVDNSLHIRLDKDDFKWWDNFGSNFPTLDLRKLPFVSMKIRSDNSFSIQVFIQDANNVGVSSPVKRVKGGSEFTELLLDWSNNQSPDGGKTFIDLSRISLMYYIINIGVATHDDYYISEVRIGDQAHGIPLPQITMSRTADQSLYVNAKAQTIDLSEISPGFGSTEIVTVSATSNNAALISSPSVSSVSNGKAILSYTPLAGATGNAQVIVEATATGSASLKDTFNITIVSSNPSTAETVTLNASTTYQAIEGFGAFIIGDNTDLAITELGLNVERLNLPTSFEPVNDNSSADIINRKGFDISVIDFNSIKVHKAAGIEKFITSLWSPPAWMKKNFHEEGPQAWGDVVNDRLDPVYYDEFAEYLAAYIKVVKDETGVDIYAISIQNELEFEEFYGGCIYSPEEYKNVVIAVGRRFKTEGITTKLFGPENLYFQSGPEPYINAINNDPEAKQYFDIVAVHYTESRDNWTSAHQTAMEAPQKSLWVSEAGAGAGENSVSYNWTNAMSTANAWYNALNYQYGSANGWVYWEFGGTLLNPAHQVTPGYWVTKNYSKYIRTNAVQINSTSTNSDLLVTAFHHVKDSSLAVVLVNNNTTPTEVKFVGLSASDLPSKFKVFRSAEYVNFEEVDSLKPAQSNILLLPAKSVTTIYGTGSKKIVASIETEMENNVKLSYYPNPVSEMLNVNIPQGNYGTVSITDLLGRQLLSRQIKAGEKTIQLNVGTLSKGLYLINVNGEKKLNGKFIVE